MVAIFEWLRLALVMAWGAQFRFIVVILLALAPTVSTASDEDPKLIDACNRLAAHPLDFRSPVSGVPDAEVDTTAAIDSCREALNNGPSNILRTRFQLGRALLLAGRIEEAVPHLETAAVDYAMAQYVLCGLYFRGEGVAKDVERARELALLAWNQVVPEGGHPGSAAKPLRDALFLSGYLGSQIDVLENLVERAWRRDEAAREMLRSEVVKPAIEKARRETNQDVAQAEYVYGWLLVHGYTVHQGSFDQVANRRYGQQLLRRAAEQSYLKAFEYLNRVHTHPLMLAVSAKLLEQDGEDAGRLNAMLERYDLSSMHEWCVWAADHFYGDGNFCLGQMYRYGIVVEKDLDRAMEELRLAEARGAGDTSSFIEDLREEME